MAVGARHPAWRERLRFGGRVRKELVAPPDVFRQRRVVQRRLRQRILRNVPRRDHRRRGRNERAGQEWHAVGRLADGGRVAAGRPRRAPSESPTTAARGSSTRSLPRVIPWRARLHMLKHTSDSPVERRSFLAQLGRGVTVAGSALGCWRVARKRTVRVVHRSSSRTSRAGRLDGQDAGQAPPRLRYDDARRLRCGGRVCEQLPDGRARTATA